MLFISPVVAASATPSAVSAMPPLSARAVRILDGDTFAAVVHMESGANVSVNVRIRNIDAPEIHGACEYESKWAEKSKNRLAELLPQGTEMILIDIKDDKYLKRIDARVRLNGKDIGDIMIKENMAVPYNGGRRKGWCQNFETKGETK